MSGRLPPLTALRAFEAAARHMSFAKAAAELNVTPAALSFQIKSLEEHLGRPVFRRLNRAVELTPEGRALAPGASDGFDALAGAWRAARRAGSRDSIMVTAGPAFTAKWLAPRFFAFVKDHPEIELRFSAGLRIMDFDRDEIDVAIRFGLGPDAGLFSRTLIDEWVTPVMVPELAAQITTPEALRDATLFIQDDIAFLDPPLDWGAWFRAAGVSSGPIAGTHFSQSDHAVDAALAGGGVALGRISLISRDLADGRLVAPFDLGLSTRANYRFVCPAGAEARPEVKAFMDWIFAEAAHMATLQSGRTIVKAEDVPR